MKRLGMWNRLAVVLIALTSIVAPTWLIIDQRAHIIETNSNGYKICMKDAALATADGGTSAASCSRAWFRDDQWYPGWTEWWQTAGGVLLLCVIGYALIWLAVALAKWIWRGRQPN